MINEIKRKCDPFEEKSIKKSKQELNDRLSILIDTLKGEIFVHLSLREIIKLKGLNKNWKLLIEEQITDVPPFKFQKIPSILSAHFQRNNGMIIHNQPILLGGSYHCNLSEDKIILMNPVNDGASMETKVFSLTGKLLFRQVLNDQFCSQQIEDLMFFNTSSNWICFNVVTGIKLWEKQGKCHDFLITEKPFALFEDSQRNFQLIDSYTGEAQRKVQLPQNFQLKPEASLFLSEKGVIIDNQDSILVYHFETDSLEKVNLHIDLDSIFFDREYIVVSEVYENILKINFINPFSKLYKTQQLKFEEEIDDSEIEFTEVVNHKIGVYIAQERQFLLIDITENKIEVFSFDFLISENLKECSLFRDFAILKFESFMFYLNFNTRTITKFHVNHLWGDDYSIEFEIKDDKVFLTQSKVLSRGI